MKTCFNPKSLALGFSLLILSASLSSQIITTVAGTGIAGFSGDGGQASASKLTTPRTMTFDATGNMYIADYGNNCIRKISTAGVITTVAGTGTAGFSGDGGPATAAKLNGPKGVITDAGGNLYIADAYNMRIRKVNAAGIITTIAGTGISGFSGDGGQATAAQLNYPERTILDAAGNLYITDYYNHRIRKINSAGVISTIAGSGTAGFGGDGGPATAAKLNNPVEATFDAQGNLYIADYSNNRVRMVNPAGIMTTFAGTGTAGFGGDGGQAALAQLKNPYSVSIDCAGNVFIADNGNNRVRQVKTTGIIGTVAGTGVAGSGGDGGLATAAQLNSLTGIAIDAGGNLYIADHNNNRVRKVSQVATQNVSINVTSASICAGATATLTASGAGSYAWSTGSTGPSITVSPGVTTTYTVNANNSECTGTATTSVLVEICTGMFEQDAAIPGLTIYPNPCSARLTIGMDASTAYDLQIMDLSGRLIVSSKELRGSYHLNTTDLTPGIYIVHLKTKDGLRSVSKFVKE